MTDIKENPVVKINTKLSNKINKEDETHNFIKNNKIFASKNSITNIKTNETKLTVLPNRTLQNNNFSSTKPQKIKFKVSTFKIPKNTEVVQLSNQTTIKLNTIIIKENNSNNNHFNTSTPFVTYSVNSNKSTNPTTLQNTNLSLYKSQSSSSTNINSTISNSNSNSIVNTTTSTITNNTVKEFERRKLGKKFKEIKIKHKRLNKEGSYNCGRWQPEEHQRFIEAIMKYGNEWKLVQKHVGTRSSTQARSHAQKFFVKIKKANVLYFNIDLSKNSIKTLHEMANNLNSDEYFNAIKALNCVAFERKANHISKRKSKKDEVNSYESKNYYFSDVTNGNLNLM